MHAGSCTYKDEQFLFVDLPGTYSIMSNSEEEEIARDYICFGEPNATVVVVDATVLERNLNLVFQTMEITDNLILCVNLLDEAKKKKINVDLKKLEEELGIPVVGTIARKKKTLNNLLNTVSKVCKKQIIPQPKKIRYEEIIEKYINKIEKVLREKVKLNSSSLYRWVSIKILDGEEKILKNIEENFKVNLNSDEDLKSICDEAYKEFEKNEINKNNFKDKIVFRNNEKGRGNLQESVQI